MRQVVLYGARVVLVTSIILYSGGLVARWGYGHFLTPTQGASFDTFTGLSRGGVSGSSGRRFQDHQCREYRGSSKLPGQYSFLFVHSIKIILHILNFFLFHLIF